MTDSFSAFDGSRRFASGARACVVKAIKKHLDRQPDASLLIFEDATGSQIDFDLREIADEAAASLSTPPPENADAARGPGRPKLGVVPREVTLLPRHWDWLAKQPGGASVTLRKLVDDARRNTAGVESARVARERAYRFMSAIAGNLSGFEEASRALFAGDSARFGGFIGDWPDDIRDYARLLAEGAFEQPADSALA
ncbi:DUF2239 family protein [Hyphomicrobium sp.]|jgi:hypothetical protein|uniref:DUF2239 family protein n=1 Tax=Hyphomicrobium sp. TaxID=82 RepID=UPI003562C35D